jgi:hypothetical protein
MAPVRWAVTGLPVEDTVDAVECRAERRRLVQIAHHPLDLGGQASGALEIADQSAGLVTARMQETRGRYRCFR